MTNREKIIELLITKQDEEFFDTIVSGNSVFIKALKEYTCSRQAISKVLDRTYHKDINDLNKGQ